MGGQEEPSGQVDAQRRPSRARRWGRRVLRGSAYVLLVVIAILAGARVLLAVARSTTRPAVFLAAGFLVYLVVAVAGHWLLTRRAPSGQRRRARLTGAGVLAGVVLVPSLIWVLPPDREEPLPPAPAGTEQWSLPTGSRLAVLRIPADHRTHDTPIVFLHGGPGFADMAHDAPAFGWFASLGYDVWLYDQVGTGHSARLADPRGYSMERDLADLEAVLDRVGADRIVLMGYSYGASLGATYLARHPERVARTVFTSPGRIVPKAFDKAGQGMLDRVSSEEMFRAVRAGFAPRRYLTFHLVKADPRAAHAFAGDAEMDRRFLDTYTALSSGLVCPGHPSPTAPDTVGYYVNQVSNGRPVTTDVRPRLRQLATPTLIVKGGCDYLPWDFATEYRDTIPGARLVYFPDAGHQLFDEYPDRYRAVVAAFLEDRPLPVAPYTGAEVPADYTGPRG